MGSLTRDQILARRESLPREPVDVPELGGAVFVRVLTLREVGEIQRDQKANVEPIKLYPKIVAMACVDEAGSPVFDRGDAEAIEALPFAAVDRIAAAVMRVSRLAPEEPGPKN